MVASVPSGVLISPVYPPTVGDLAQFSHLGGLPSLPRGLEWPRASNGPPLHFLAQIDLAAVPPSGMVDFSGKALPEFPREGALYFFADCATFGIWEQPEASHRVLYAPDCRGTRPVPPPADLMPHNAPDAPVLASTHRPYSPRLRPRPQVLLPHVPISLTDMPSALDAARADPWPDWSPTQLLNAGFPWRWLLLERTTISLASGSDWPGGTKEANITWHQRALNENPLDRIPKETTDEFCDWLRNLVSCDRVGFDELWQAVGAAWPYVAFSGDVSDFPSELVQCLRPLDRPTEDEGVWEGSRHHKILGNAISQQGVQLSDENNVLLLRLDSDDALDFCWGDVGILQITVSRAALAARNFEHTSLDADCT
jgi:uncharacterized protein YwqG